MNSPTASNSLACSGVFAWTIVGSKPGIGDSVKPRTTASTSESSLLTIYMVDTPKKVCRLNVGQSHQIHPQAHPQLYSRVDSSTNSPTAADNQSCTPSRLLSKLRLGDRFQSSLDTDAAVGKPLSVRDPWALDALFTLCCGRPICDFPLKTAASTPCCKLRLHDPQESNRPGVP